MAGQFSTPKPKRQLATDVGSGDVIDLGGIPAGVQGVTNKEGGYVAPPAVATGQVTTNESRRGPAQIDENGKVTNLATDTPAVKPSGTKVWYFCTDQAHGISIDGPNAIARLFEHDSAGCPTCPVCKKQVNAIVTEKDVVPDLTPRLAVGY
jgi:hypothetical protein